jgi:hypothetical protein
LAARKIANDWTDQVTMGNVTAALKGTAQMWWQQSIKMDCTAADVATVKTLWATFERVFKDTYHILVAEQAVKTGDLSHQKKGETLDDYLKRIANAASSLDFLKTEPVPNVPGAGVLLAAAMTAAGNDDPARAAVRAEFAATMVEMERICKAWAIDATAMMTAKQAAKEGLNSSRLREVAYKNMGRNVDWRTFKMNICEVDRQQRTLNGNNGNNGAKIHELEDEDDDDDTEEVDKVTGNRKPNGGKKYGGQGNQSSGKVEPWMKGKRCTWCWKMNHHISICRKKTADQAAGRARPTKPASLNAAKTTATTAATSATGTDAVITQNRFATSGNDGGSW